jgi:predicted RNA-binding protein with PUA-like domain
MPQWLMKTEPADFSWERLVAEGGTEWDGVRNYQAAIHMRAMRKGDRAFFYRSMVAPAIVGVMTVCEEAYPAPDDATGKFVRLKVKPLRPVVQEVSLAAIKAEPRLADLALVRQSRLSVLPIPDAEWRLLCEMAGIDPEL